MSLRAITRRGRLGFCDCYVADGGIAVVTFPAVATPEQQRFVRHIFDRFPRLDVEVNGNTVEARDADAFVDALCDEAYGRGEFSDSARDLLRELLVEGFRRAFGGRAMTRPRRAVVSAQYDVRPRRDGTNLVNVWLSCGHHTVVEERRPAGCGPWVVTLPEYARCPECAVRKRGAK